ncbi:MAG TPA: hypothetical protein VHB79_25595 [Polyangiaceae bacterium]|nr:hypothetical protein [Polyangiaceae bacterium]
MTNKTLECAEIRSSFVAGRIPAGLEVEEHLKWCPHCRELFENGAELGRRLARAVLPEASPDDLFALVDREVQREVGLRARLRALPTRLRAVILGGVALLLAAAHLGLRRRIDFDQYSPAVFWVVAAVLAAAIALGVWRLLRGSTAPLAFVARERSAAFGLLVTPAAAALLVPLGSTSEKWLSTFGDPQYCFLYGAVLSLPLLGLYWLFERRDRVPLVALVTAGAVAGLAGNLLLFTHCPSAHLGHLLLGHATIGVALSLLLAGLWRPSQRSG